MSLRTDYKDAVFTGSRKYNITSNDDGTSGIEDCTTYEQEGTKFGAKDVNETNAAINLLNHTTEVTLLAARWEGSAAPYSQTVAIAGVTEEMEAMLVSAMTDDLTEAMQRKYTKAFGIISSGFATLGNGTATFKVWRKPEIDCTVGLRGV